MTTLTLYRSVTGIARRLPFPGAVGRAAKGRKRAARQWTAWAAQSRADPVVWVHGASVGEALTATPVIGRLRRAQPKVQVVHSFSSPSVETWPTPFARDFATYVPWDNRRAVRRVLDAVRPELLVFSRGDLWPELVTQAVARAVPIAIIGGSVTANSLRLRLPARRLFQTLLRDITWIGAATPDDAGRWAQLGAPADRVEVTGDPRHDEVLERVPRLEPLHPLIPWAAVGPTLVAGSLEPPDIGPVCEAAARVLAHAPDSRLLLVPHAPTAHIVNAIQRTAGTNGLSVDIWPSSPEEAPSTRCVIVAARGLLFDLYALATAAYVGGGFMPRKLHAVIEPAAYGLPIAIGPHWRAFPDAAALVANGGAVSLPRRHAAAVLHSTWLAWLQDQCEAADRGLEARRMLTGGAAQASAARLAELLGPSPASTPITRPFAF